MVHGWPGSFYEFYKIIPLLTDPKSHGLSDEHVFEVICPSIPGYGFSEASSKKGKNLPESQDILSYQAWPGLPTWLLGTMRQEAPERHSCAEGPACLGSGLRPFQASKATGGLQSSTVCSLPNLRQVLTM